jgi:Tfp pilus assembly protein PilP
MTKFLLFISIGIIVYLLLQPSSNAPLDKTESTNLAPPIVSDPIVKEELTEKEASMGEEIQNLPTESEATPVAADAAVKKTGVTGLKLIGTIYGNQSASAMLADANNKTFVVRLNQKVLKTDYLVTRIDKDRVYLKKDSKTYILVMNKVR